MQVVDGSDLLTGKMKTKVQDAYSMRSTPQVIGAARDAGQLARTQVEIELNGVADNPIFVPELDLTLTGANFRVHSGPSDGHGGHRHYHGLRSLRTAFESLDQSGTVARLAGLSRPRAGILLRAHVEPIHRRSSHRRATASFRSRIDSIHSGRRRSRRLCVDGDEYGTSRTVRSWTMPMASSESSSWPPPKHWISVNSHRGVERRRRAR